VQHTTQLLHFCPRKSDFSCDDKNMRSDDKNMRSDQEHTATLCNQTEGLSALSSLSRHGHFQLTSTRADLIVVLSVLSLGLLAFPKYDRLQPHTDVSESSSSQGALTGPRIAASVHSPPYPLFQSSGVPFRNS
jgi:hypothetical protein